VMAGCFFNLPELSKYQLIFIEYPLL
jgi:hypothetical protein